MRRFGFAGLAVFLAAATVACSAAAQNATIIYRFNGGANGSGPVGRVVSGGANIVYGTTSQGGTQGRGTVFSLTRTGATWTHKVLYSFKGGADGAFPEGDLVITPNGVLYGTTTSGGSTSATCGSGGCGTVFSITPNAAKTVWTERVIHRFTGGAGGREPRAGVIFREASLYGTTYTGGTAGGFGTVFRLTPNAARTVWTRSIIYAFKGGADGGNPEAEVVFNQGDLFGLTSREGIKTGPCSQDSRGCGTAFMLQGGAATPWVHTVLYRFRGGSDGMEPGGPLTFKSRFYGTTRRGGAANKGTVFSLTLNAARNAVTKRGIFSFPAGNGGKDPEGVVFRGNDLLGVTTTDGTATFAGTVYRLTPAGAAWTFSQLDRFTGGMDGDTPRSRLLLGPSSIVYGVTFSGGNGNGTVFEMFRP